MKGGDYHSQRRWSDWFNPEVIRILQRLYRSDDVKISSFHQDTQLACDLVVGESVHVAARIREHDAFQKWPNDFTIRERSRCNRETELTKILKGHAHVMFYGFATPEEDGVHFYRLVDLESFRWSFQSGDQYVHQQIQRPFKNHDGSRLAAFNTKHMSPEIVITSDYPARQHHEPLLPGMDDLGWSISIT